ncbi:MAG TPA: hypothetical protein VK914_01560 [bacterium]|jgi:hypothetical protein|nr:hypothetical protein [bacterium]
MKKKDTEKSLKKKIHKLATVQSEDGVQKELINIKILLVMQLLNAGVKQSEIATALRIDASNLSRLVPARLVSKREPK